MSIKLENEKRELSPEEAARAAVTFIHQGQIKEFLEFAATLTPHSNEFGELNAPLGVARSTFVELASQLTPEETVRRVETRRHIGKLVLADPNLLGLLDARYAGIHQKDCERHERIARPPKSR